MPLPDPVLRFALAVRMRCDASLTPVQRGFLEQRLTPQAAPLTAVGLARVQDALLAWLETYDARSAAVVRSHLAGELYGPHHAQRSTEGMLKVAAISERIREEREALPEPKPRRRRPRSPHPAAPRAAG
jgi:hypothetical protein